MLTAAVALLGADGVAGRAAGTQAATFVPEDSPRSLLSAPAANGGLSLVESLKRWRRQQDRSAHDGQRRQLNSARGVGIASAFAVGVKITKGESVFSSRSFDRCPGDGKQTPHADEDDDAPMRLPLLIFFVGVTLAGLLALLLLPCGVQSAFAVSILRSIFLLVFLLHISPTGSGAKPLASVGSRVWQRVDYMCLGLEEFGTSLVPQAFQSKMQLRASGFTETLAYRSMPQGAVELLPGIPGLHPPRLVLNLDSRCKVNTQDESDEWFGDLFADSHCLESATAAGMSEDEDPDYELDQTYGQGTCVSYDDMLAADPGVEDVVDELIKGYWQAEGALCEGCTGAYESIVHYTLAALLLSVLCTVLIGNVASEGACFGKEFERCGSGMRNAFTVAQVSEEETTDGRWRSGGSWSKPIARAGTKRLIGVVSVLGAVVLGMTVLVWTTMANCVDLAIAVETSRQIVLRSVLGGVEGVQVHAELDASAEASMWIAMVCMWLAFYCLFMLPLKFADVAMYRENRDAWWAAVTEVPDSDEKVAPERQDPGHSVGDDSIAEFPMGDPSAVHAMFAQRVATQASRTQDTALPSVLGAPAVSTTSDSVASPTVGGVGASGSERADIPGTDSRLAVGAVVAIQGLTSAAGIPLNGQDATVLKAPSVDTGGQWGVQLRSDSRTFSLSAENLRLVSQTADDGKYVSLTRAS